MPAYGKDERTEEGGLNVDTFSLTINVAEDTRPNGMKIDVVPSSVDFPYTKILAEETGNYDWYIMEKSFNWNDLYEGKYLSGEKISGYQVTSSRAIYKIDGHESNSCGDIYEYPPKGLYFVIGSLYSFNISLYISTFVVLF